MTNERNLYSKVGGNDVSLEKHWPVSTAPVAMGTKCGVGGCTL